MSRENEHQTLYFTGSNNITWSVKRSGVRQFLSTVDTHLEVTSTRSTNGESEGENETRERQEQGEGIDPPSK